MATGGGDTVSGYRLSRDDGERLDVSGGAWEAALELAYLYGWRPAGTEAPTSDAWRRRSSSPAPLLWDAQDYFSHLWQRVGERDARALAQALGRALLQVPGEAQRGERPVGPRAPAGVSPMPTRATAKAEGLSASRRSAMDRLAVFANNGGFTIDGSARI